MLSKFKKAVAAAASAVFILTSAVALPASALETLAADSEGNSIAVEFPSSDKDKKVVGNSGIDITGTAAAGSSLTVSAEGKNVGTATVGADGKFTASVPSYTLSSGLNEIVLSDGAGASASVEAGNHTRITGAEILTERVQQLFIGSRGFAARRICTAQHPNQPRILQYPASEHHLLRVRKLTAEILKIIG